MRFFKWTFDKKHRLVFQAKKTMVVRAMLNTERHENVIVATFKLRTPRTDGITGEIIDEVQIEMDVWEANEFAGDLMAALDAAMPTRRRAAARIPWEG